MIENTVLDLVYKRPHVECIKSSEDCIIHFGSLIQCWKASDWPFYGSWLVYKLKGFPRKNSQVFPSCNGVTFMQDRGYVYDYVVLQKCLFRLFSLTSEVLQHNLDISNGQEMFFICFLQCMILVILVLVLYFTIPCVLMNKLLHLKRYV